MRDTRKTNPAAPEGAALRREAVLLSEGGTGLSEGPASSPEGRTGLSEGRTFRFGRHAPLVLALALAALLPGSAVGAQDDSPAASLEARLPAARAFNHAMTVERQYYPAADVTRVWIASNEDDLRLHTPAGALNDMMLQVEYFVEGPPPGSLPFAVTLSIQTNGAMSPGPTPHGLQLLADGRPLRLEETPTEAAESGGLVFLHTSARIGIDEFVALVNASTVTGRCWGHDFVLVEKQMEVLRQMASEMRQTSGDRVIGFRSPLSSFLHRPSARLP